MKQTLHLASFIVLTFFAATVHAQVTQLSNNTNIEFGAPLGNLGIMVDDHGALWKTDGTPAGTMIYTSKVLKDTSEEAAFLNNKIYFAGANSSGSELWVTDGTNDGTELIKDINPGAASSFPRRLFVFNNTIYFFAKTTSAGVELWKSDGTSGGTSMVKDINPGSGNSFFSDFSFFVANNNVLFFDANDGTHGTELWKTDGTSGGTVMVKDINPGSASSNCQGFTPLGSNLVFSADDGTHGAEPWRSDGSAGGTQLVKDIVAGTGSSSPEQFVQFQNKLFFLTVAGFPLPTYKLYSTDGTSANTALVKSLGGFALLTFSVIIDNKLLFSAFQPTSGLELWSSDGTAGGTQIFKDINPGAASANAIILPDIIGASYAYSDFHTRLYQGNKIFFFADDGTHGTELWITDGTVANTQMVKDINPGSGSSMENLLPWFYTTTDFYFGANNGSSGYELYKTDGTAGNTSLVKDINPGSNSSNPNIFMFVDGHIYLSADDGDNENGNLDLYKVDETVSLPVTLLNFTAASNGKAVDLNWSTANETNTKNFVIQRSYDGMHFDNIGSVNAAGNSTRQLNYQYTDASAFSGGSKVYYRLQMVDNDGRFTYSKIALVTILSDGNFVVMYPNPVKDQLIVVSNAAVSKGEIRITDQTGRLVYQKQFENIAGGELNKINVAGFAKGVYYLQFITGSDKQTIKFIKQ